MAKDDIVNECPLRVSPYSNALKTAWHIRSNNVYLSDRFITLTKMTRRIGVVGVSPWVTRVTLRASQIPGHLVSIRTFLLLYFLTLEYSRTFVNSLLVTALKI